MHQRERFVVIMYKSKERGLVKVNEARHRLFKSGTN